MFNLEKFISDSVTFSIYGIYSTIVTIVIYNLETKWKHCFYSLTIISLTSILKLYKIMHSYNNELLNFLFYYYQY